MTGNMMYVGTCGYGGQCNACCHGKTCLQARITGLSGFILHSQPFPCVKLQAIHGRTFPRTAFLRQNGKTYQKLEVSTAPRYRELCRGIISSGLHIRGTYYKKFILCSILHTSVKDSLLSVITFLYSRFNLCSHVD